MAIIEKTNLASLESPNSFSGTNDFTAITLNGGNAMEFFSINTLIFNGGTIPANSQVSTTLAVTGVTDIGMVAMVNCNAPIDQLVYTATVDPSGTVNLHITNPTTTARASGNRTYTLIVIGA